MIPDRGTRWNSLPPRMRAINFLPWFGFGGEGGQVVDLSILSPATQSAVIFPRYRCI
jgi:hypothetical protein